MALRISQWNDDDDDDDNNNNNNNNTEQKYWAQKQIANADFANNLKKQQNT